MVRYNLKWLKLLHPCYPSHCCPYQISQIYALVSMSYPFTFYKTFDRIQIVVDFIQEVLSYTERNNWNHFYCHMFHAHNSQKNYMPQEHIYAYIICNLSDTFKRSCYPFLTHQKYTQQFKNFDVLYSILIVQLNINSLSQFFNK